MVGISHPGSTKPAAVMLPEHCDSRKAILVRTGIAFFRSWRHVACLGSIHG